MRTYREVLKYLKDYVVDRIILTEFDPETLSNEWEGYTPTSDQIMKTVYDYAVKFEEIIADTIASGKKIFGICVGMQILFQESTEKGKHSGLGILNGSIDLLDAPVLPHIGWNTVDGGEGISFFSGIENEFFYFVHSYGVPTVTHKDGIATSTYGSTFIAAIEYENIFATQFHPEKSGSAGLRLISNWIKTL